MYNVDDLKAQTEAARAKRHAALPEVYDILEEGKNNYLQWKEKRKNIEVLMPFKHSLDKLKENLSAKYKSQLSVKSHEVADQMLKDFVQKAFRIQANQSAF